MFTGPVGPVGLFLLARSSFGEFLLAWGHRFTLSVEPCLPKHLSEYIRRNRVAQSKLENNFSSRDFRTIGSERNHFN